MGFWKDLWNDDKPWVVYEHIHIDDESLKTIERMQMNKYKYDLLKNHPEIRKELEKRKELTYEGSN